MPDFDDALAVALDATLAMTLAYLFSDGLGDLLAGELVEEVRNNSRATDDEAEEALEQAERQVAAMTPELIGGMVVARLFERRKGTR
jgi:hypothetical protein